MLNKKHTNMPTMTNYTRKEFIEVMRKAKQRKKEWQSKVEKELEAIETDIQQAKEAIAASNPNL